MGLCFPEIHASFLFSDAKQKQSQNVFLRKSISSSVRGFLIFPGNQPLLQKSIPSFRLVIFDAHGQSLPGAHQDHQLPPPSDANNPSGLGPLATTVFHPTSAIVGTAQLPDTPALLRVTGELMTVLEQACGSSLTYVWGPPGTGKTFAIAHLVTALIESGERVLVTSHTHAAVDQAAYATVKSETGREGPLADHPAVKDGKVIRIGRTLDKKIAPIQLNNPFCYYGAGLLPGQPAARHPHRC